MDAETKDLCTALRDPEALYRNGAALADEAAELIETLCARLESPLKSVPSPADDYRAWLIEAFESWEPRTSSLERAIAFIKESEIDGKRYVEPPEVHKPGGEIERCSNCGKPLVEWVHRCEPAACENCGATERPDRCSGGSRCMFPPHQRPSCECRSYGPFCIRAASVEPFRCEGLPPKPQSSEGG